MKNIKIAKKEVAEFEVIEAELMNFTTKVSAALNLIREADEYFTQVMVLDIAQNLYYTFRNKVERFGSNRGLASMTVSPREAVVLMLVACQELNRWNDYQAHVMRKLMAELHKQVTDLNRPRETYSSKL